MSKVSQCLRFVSETEREVGREFERERERGISERGREGVCERERVSVRESVRAGKCTPPPRDATYPV